jgi:hypothetical protein
MNRLLTVVLALLVLATIPLLSACTETPAPPQQQAPVTTEVPITPTLAATFTPTATATVTATATATITGTIPPPPTPPGDLGYLESWPSGLPIDPGGHITEVLAVPTIAPIQVTLYQVANWSPDPGTTPLAGNYCRTVLSRPNHTWAGLPLGPRGAPSTIVDSADLKSVDPSNNLNPMPILVLTPRFPQSGQYGWHYREGCYFVALQRPGETAVIYSPVVGVRTGYPVDDLDFCLHPWPTGEWGSGKAPPPYKLICNP